MYSLHQFLYKKLSSLIFLVVSVSFFANAQQEPVPSIAGNISLKSDERTAENEQRHELSLFEQQTLFGSFFGIRTLSAPVGVELGGTIKNDLWQNISGGNDQHGSDIVNVDLTISVDLHEAISWNGASFFVHFLGNNGTSVSDNVGDFQMISNIEAYSTGKLYQCWFQQNFYDDKLSLLAGIYDLNSEFYVTETSGLFLNGSHGVGIELGQTGNNGPSIFPNAALAFRGMYLPFETIYAQFALFDGMPGDPNDPTKFGVALSSAEGYFAVAEIGRNIEDGGKVGVGLWKYSGTFGDLCSEIDPSITAQRSDNYGGYLLIDQPLYHSETVQTEVLNGFFRVGFANGHVNCFNYHIGAGIVYSGFFPSREDDELGFAIASAHASSDFQMFVQSVYSENAATETSHELTYKMKLAEWFFIQYDIQYIVHPSANPSIANAVAGGIRVEINL